MLIIIILIILLLNPALCLKGAAAGINLWFNTVFPTLLPFIIISNIILNVYSKGLKNPRLYIIFIGISCGCPMAAIAACQLYRNGSITKNEAEALIGICNNLSPAFIISYVFMTTLDFDRIPLKLIAATYIPVLLLLAIESVYFKGNVSNSGIPDASDKKSPIDILDESIMNAFATITRLGGYIIIFNIIAAYAEVFTKQLPFLRCILTGAAEITTGMGCLSFAPIPFELKCLIAGGLVSFGGLCCMMQTISITSSHGLSTKKYIYHKILLSLITMAAYYLAVYVL